MQFYTILLGSLLLSTFLDSGSIVSARQFGFTASFSGRISAPANPVPLKLVSPNIKDSFNTASYSYTTTSIVIYFSEICAGLVAGQPATLSLVQGDKTAMGLTWESKIHNASETVCRSGLLQLPPSVTQKLALNSGTVFSDNFETMLSVFSVSDAMSDDASKRTVHAIGNIPSGYTGVIRLTPTIGASSGVFDAGSSAYTCTTEGLYFISYTVGANPSEATRVDLVGVVVNGKNRNFELFRESRSHNGVTMLTRSVLTPCSAGAKLYLKVNAGGAVSQTDHQPNTFSAFPYLPRNITKQAWSVLKDFSSNTKDNKPLDPFSYNIIAYNSDGLYSENTKTVTIRKSGFYYVYIGTGTGNYRPAYYILQRNGATLIAINHQTRTQDGDANMGHGAVVALNANDVLKVVGAVETFSYANTYGLQTSFFGMLLYNL